MLIDKRQAFRTVADEGPYPAEGGGIGARRRLERQPDCRGAPTPRSYFGVSDGGPPSRWRTRRIASHKKTMTTPSAASGAARANTETRTAPTNSAVEISALPTPPVKMVDFARRTHAETVKVGLEGEQ